jgi:hypothetical protein
LPKPAYFGVARAYRGAPSAQFATWAWGGESEARALVSGPARFVDLDGTVVAESTAGEVVAPLDSFGHDVFLLDLEDGRNRYVMTRTENLAPLLSLPPAALDRDGSHLRNVGAVAALGIVAEEDVFDLLPDEEREAGDVRDPGWNARL